MSILTISDTPQETSYHAFTPSLSCTSCSAAVTRVWTAGANLLTNVYSCLRRIGGWEEPDKTICFDNGDKYTGQCVNEVPTGQGTYSFANGELYEGEFVNGVPNGRGTFYYKTGEIYSGQFVDGTRCDGHGTFTSIDGDKYEGEFVNGIRRDGHGILTSIDGDRYEGQFVDGIRCDGHGTLTFANGDKYEGQFVKEKFHGHGIYRLPDGVAIYEGEFVNHCASPNLAKETQSPQFLELLLGGENTHLPEYSLSLMAQSLEELGYPEESNLLHSAFSHMINPPTLDSLSQLEPPKLFYYGSGGHAMGTLLSTDPNDPNKITVRIFNSGEGLYEFHEFDNQKQKFRTTKTFSIPNNQDSLSLLVQAITKNTDTRSIKKAYAAISTIPGAEEITDQTPWTSEQKGNSCTIGWISAFLLHQMGPARYHEMRLKLFKYWRGVADEAPWATDDMKQELDRKIEKRQQKLGLPSSGSIAGEGAASSS